MCAGIKVKPSLQVPFGDTGIVKDWLHISGQVGRPDPQHPKRPISGLDCKRKEVSGSRFWGLMRDLCSEPHTFFRNCYVHNYCPLCFMGESGKNITPPSLRVRERRQLEGVCDRALLETVEVLGVKWIVCIGKYVEVRARKVIMKQLGNYVNKVCQCCTHVGMHVVMYTLMDVHSRRYALFSLLVQSLFSSLAFTCICTHSLIYVRNPSYLTTITTGDLRKPDDGHITVCNIMHPSPINPLANKGWAKCVQDQLSQLKLIDIISGAS